MGSFIQLPISMGLTDITGEIATELIKVLSDVVRRSVVGRSSAEQLMATVQELSGFIQEIKYSGVELPAARQFQLDRISEDLRKGMELCQKMKSLSRFNVYKSLHYARKLEKIDNTITRFIQGSMQLNMWADIHRLTFTTMERFDRMDGSMTRLENQITGMDIGSDHNP